MFKTWAALLVNNNHKWVEGPSTTNHGHQMLQGTLNGLIVRSTYLRSGMQRSWEEKHHHNDLSQGNCLVSCSSPNLNQILTDASAHLIPVSRKEKRSLDVRKITLELPVLCMDWNYTHQDQQEQTKIASTQIIGPSNSEKFVLTLQTPSYLWSLEPPPHTLMWTQ